jgi:hypothetical protein
MGGVDFINLRAFHEGWRRFHGLTPPGSLTRLKKQITITSRAVHGARNKQPTANSQQPTANSQQTTDNRQQTTENGSPARVPAVTMYAFHKGPVLI